MSLIFGVHPRVKPAAGPDIVKEVGRNILPLQGAMRHHQLKLGVNRWRLANLREVFALSLASALLFAERFPDMTLESQAASVDEPWFRYLVSLIN